MLTLDLVDITGWKLHGPQSDAYKGQVPRRMKYLHPSVLPNFVALLEEAPWMAFSDIYRDPIASLEARRTKAGVQRPGYSAHNYGFAFDADVDQCLKGGFGSYAQMLVVLVKHGWTCHRSDGQRGSEDWHQNALGGIDAKKFPGSSGPQRWILEHYGPQLMGDETWAQERLAKAGFYQGDIDGKFGPLSRRALMSFERAYDLTPDGILDEITMRTLAIVTAEKNVTQPDAALTDRARKLGLI